MTTAETAEVLGISQGSVSNLIYRGSLSAKKCRGEKHGRYQYIYMIPEEDVENRMRWMEEHQNDGRVKRYKEKQDDIPEVKEPEPKVVEPAFEHKFPPEFYERLDKLREESRNTKNRFDEVLARTNALVLETRALVSQCDTNHQELDISKVRMEAYKEGFKEGFKAAMEVK